MNHIKHIIPPVLLLNRSAISELLTLDDYIQVIEHAFAAHVKGGTLPPGSLSIEGNGGEFHIKAGGLQGSRSYLATKVSGGFFKNSTHHGLPNIIGLILLSNGSNGKPLAVMEAGHITKLRTAAATAVAAKYLARPKSKTVTVCGAGDQAPAQLMALTRVLPLERAFVWSRTPKPGVAARLTEQLKIDVQHTTDLKAATHQSDVIVTCTPASSWYLGLEHVRPGTFIAAVGADSPGKQELEPALLKAAAIVCDLTDQCVQIGELHHAIATGHLQRAHVCAELGEIILGLAPGRRHADEMIVFDSTGTALQDVAAATAIYERALLRGESPAFEFWS